MSSFEADVAGALERMRLSARPVFEALDVEQARNIYRAGRETLQLAPVPIEIVSDCVIAGRPARLFRPERAGEGTVLFLHGGGYVIGDLDTHDSICRHLAVASETEVVALDYRRAPEHVFPAAFTDALGAFQALEGRVAIAGDSAGGSLAMAVALATDHTPPAALALFYPVTDVAAEAPSYARVKDVPISGATMRWFWNHAFAAGDNRSDARMSPLRSERLGAMPPTFLTTAGQDPLCDEGLMLAERLRSAGRRVEHRHLPGQIHGYLTMGRQIGEAERSIGAAGRFLADQLRAA